MPELHLLDSNGNTQRIISLDGSNHAVIYQSDGTTEVIDLEGHGSRHGSGAADPLGLFISTEQTATGSEQDVAHGLGYVPTKVLVCITELPDAVAETGFDIAEGTHDATNVKITATATIKFKVFAY